MAKSSGGIRGGRQSDGYPIARDEWYRGYIDLHRGQNAKKVFEAINNAEEIRSRRVNTFKTSRYTYIYRSYGGNILSNIAKNATGAPQDIARKFGTVEGTSFPMSDKQKWALSYAFIKLKPSQI